MKSHAQNYHLFSALNRNVVYDPRSMRFFVVDAPSAVILRDHRPEALLGGFGKACLRFGPHRAAASLSSLQATGLLRESPPARATRAEDLRPLSTLELCVTHACNLACRYCYGSQTEGGCPAATGLLYGAHQAQMSEETAKAGIDLLLAHSGRLRAVNVVFFGGEPFLNFRLIRAATLYAKRQAARAGKRVRLSAVTNGTRLTPEVLGFVKANGIRLQVSMDGPPEIHDVNRPRRGGRGSYAAVRKGLDGLATVQGKPPGRATAAHGNEDAMAVMTHLRAAGCGSVHLEPALWNSGAATMDAHDIDRLLAQEEGLAQSIVDGLDTGEVIDYHALTRLIRDTRVIRERRRYFCGAGRGLICLTAEGDIYPCHRFAGQEVFRLGSLKEGLDHDKRQPYRRLHVDARPGCRECWARHLCGGGCWDHAVGAHGALERRDQEKSCRIMRRRLELAMAANALIAEKSANASVLMENPRVVSVMAQ